MLEFTDKIYDNVFGFIEITELEKELINSPYFQRLREIKQLGFAYYVFPGATHTRFSHSIGVMHLAYKMIKNIKRNTDDSIDINGGWDNAFQKIRIAALLHDIGHYPFSHTIEQAYKDIEKEKTAEKHSNFFKGEFEEDIDNNDKFSESEAKTNKAHHEHLGAYIILNTNYENGITKILLDYDFREKDINDIANIIQQKSTTIWFNNIINSEMDADRFDYLIRDSNETGVAYGSFDLDYLIRHLKLVEVNNKKVVAVENSAVFSVEHFLLARYFWYSQIIFDRTISIFNEMALIIYKDYLRKAKVHTFDDLQLMIKDKDRYQEFLRFNDHYFWQKLYKNFNNKQSYDNSQYIKKMSKLLNDRIPLRECKISNLNMKLQEKNPENIKKLEEATNKIKKDICSLFNKKSNKKWVHSLINKPTIISFKPIKGEDYDVELDLTEEDLSPIFVEAKGQNITNLNSVKHSLVQELSNMQLLIPRIYIEEDLYLKYEKEIKKITN